MGYALFQTIGGWLADRLGSRAYLPSASCGGVFSTSLTAAVSIYNYFCSSGSCGGPYFFGPRGCAFPRFQPFNFALDSLAGAGVANGLIFAGVGVGAGATPFLITYIMVHYGWRWSF